MNLLRTAEALGVLRRPVLGDYGAGLRRRIARLFPARSSEDREAILQAFLRYAICNRAIYRLTMFAPAIAAGAARLIPIVGRPIIQRANEHGGPILVASAHFGSLYLLSFIVARALPGRRLYVMHKNTIADAARNEAFLHRCGMIPVAADERGLVTLVRALQDDPRAAILLAFDAPTETRHVIRFLATHLPVSSGIGMMADVGRCPVVPLFWQYDGLRPSVVIDQPLYVNANLPVSRRRIALVAALYALLEARVERFPEQWQLDLIGDAPTAASPATRTTLERI